DADCEVPENWLTEFDCFIQKTEVKFISGPVVFEKGKGLLNIFQRIDFMSLQGATIGGFGIGKAFMCNAANLCYEKSVFIELNGFSGNEKIASGDDIFLLEKMQSAGHKIGYLKSKSAIISTQSQPTFAQLVNQRVRWAAKASAYQNPFSKFVGILILLMNLSIILGLNAALFGIIDSRYFFYVFLVKFNVDFLLIYPTAIFFENEKLLKNYFWCSFIYPFFTGFIALKASLYGYSWKDRRFRR
ncbi:MAG TPA: glycosyltransferase family 2 protein, partial [Salinimicrobium sp.]|nr:glycosyltransferase family 2 protein [Salinimicrobium sp.]